MTWRNSMEAHRERLARRARPKRSQPAPVTVKPQHAPVDHCVAALAAGGFPTLPTRTGAA